MADEWYYTRQGQQQGPVGAAQLKQLAASGQLLPTDLVWKEGLANWVPASSARGLFPPATAPASGRAKPAPAAPVPTSGRIQPAAAAAPASGRTGQPAGLKVPVHVSPIDDDEDYDEAPEQRPRRKSKGLSTGAWVAIIGGSVGGLLLISLVILLIVLLGRGTSYSTTTLQPRMRDTRFVEFQAGKPVEITVTSDHNTDVDLFVFDQFGRQVASDESLGPNSFVRFVPAQTGRYRLEVVNLGPLPNRSHVRYRQ
jgi:hypothetical protein